jgi:hypothetical protein
MSLSEISIEARSIINSLAATSNLSAVAFLPLGSLVGALVVKGDRILSGDEPASADKPKPKPSSRVN